MDEIDTWHEKTDLRAVLNAGFRKGATVPRMWKKSDNWDAIQKTPVFGPKVLAGIKVSDSILAPATRSRTFEIELTRKLPSEKVERFNQIAKESLKALHTEIEAWAKAEAAKVNGVYLTFEPKYLKHYSDRSQDLLMPLAAIAEVMGGSSVSDLIDAIPFVRKEEQHVNEDIRIFDALRQHVNGTSLKMSAGEVKELLEAKLGGCFHETVLGHVLTRYGFTSGSDRSASADGSPKKRYDISSGALDEVLARFGPQATAKVGT